MSEMLDQINRILNPPINEPEMVERVARALCTEKDGWRLKEGQPWFIDSQWHIHIPAARAAIEAMREIPQPLLDLMTPEGIPGPRLYQAELKQSWSFMIDAALTGGK